MKPTPRKNGRILRPVVYIEYSSLLLAVLAIMRVYAVGVRRVRLTVMCGDKPEGRYKYWVFPVIRLIRR